MFLIFDVETTGFIKGDSNDFSNLNNFPRVVQLAFQLHDEKGKLIQQYSQIVKPEGFEIPYDAAKIHKITTERALKEGVELSSVLNEFLKALEKTKVIAGHNIISYDIPVISAELIRNGFDANIFNEKIIIDTCVNKEVIEYCALPGGKGGGFKAPSLTELHEKLFGVKFDLAHNAAFDVEANANAFFELLSRNIIRISQINIQPDQIEYESPNLINLKIKESVYHQKKQKPTFQVNNDINVLDDNLYFAYLHNHTIYSIGNSSTQVKDLVKKAAEYKARALAITDLGYMSGVIEFFNAVKEINKEIKSKNENAQQSNSGEVLPLIKPIIGCEFYLCDDMSQKNTYKTQNFQIPILAKNEIGYSNLCKLSSVSFTEGFYYVPRIDKKRLLENKEGLIILSGWIYGEIPQVLFKEGEQKAEECVLWYKKNFGENFYLEMNNHFLEEEEYLNKFLIKMSEKHNIKIVAAQNNFYLNRNDAEGFDTLICIRNGEEKSKPIGKGSGKRYGLPNDQFYFKSPQEILQAFSFYPQAIQNAIELAESIEEFPVEKQIVLPKFTIPEEFAKQHSELSELELENAYLKYLTYEGAKKRYKEITKEIEERIEFELQTIAQMGFPGYFLIVSDILNSARKKGIRIGPGRGSAAGSIVAYCLGITNVDPVQYNLLFERFLNPERVSMPDIDIDIEDTRRDELIEYVIEKYGKECVANIITFSTLGGKSAIKDTARVLGLLPQEADALSKAFNPLFEMKISLKELIEPDKINFEKYLPDGQSLDEFKAYFQKSYEEFLNTHPRAKEVLEYAAKVEGCFRHTGKHACGLIIAPKRLDEIAPLAIDTKSGQVITQFDVSVAESAGLLKMDFLGLTTLSIISETLRLVKKNKGIEIDIDNIPLNDEKTFEIFKNGYTDEVFQFESPGMKKYLQQLKPDSIHDLVAMNALYRPGPMKYIDSYIRRKHGIEKIEYPFPEMEEILKETYGITVYQEQVMLLSQKLAGFTKGQADELRKAMGKKKIDVLEKMEQKFLEGCKKNGYDLDIVKKIWEDWKDFASYAFNKSHSVCYAILAYQTAYLKAHFPSEFMCAALNTKGDVDSIAKVLTECRRMGIKILPPDINESDEKFNVSEKGDIRFGLSSIKNVGQNFAEEWIQNRTLQGKIKNIFELAERLSSKLLNKKNIENLAKAGAFDSLGITRATFFVADKEGVTLTDKLIKFSENIKKKQNIGNSLFDISSAENSGFSQYPDIQIAKEWDIKTKLRNEEEVLGLYISSTPLDTYQLIFDSEPNKMSIQELNEQLSDDPESLSNKTIIIYGWADEIQKRYTKNGKEYYSLKLQDTTGSIDLFINNELAEQSQIKYHLNDLKCYRIKGKVEKRNVGNENNIERWDFRVLEVIEIEQLIKDKAELKVLLNVKDIQLNLIKEFEKIFNTNGGIPLKVTLVITDDERKNYVVTTNPLKINFDKENIKVFEKYNLEYKIVFNF